jgi:hypothetical protein
MTVPDLTRETRWICHHCTATDVTRIAGTHSRFHACRGMALMTIPFVPEGVDCVVETAERQDYIGAELVQRNAEGRPIMNVSTRYADGHNDLAVFMPTARGKVQAHE